MTLLEQIKKAGIVGCGGAGFPTHVKLNCTVEYLIINAAECEPLLRTDRYLMIHKADEMIAAVRMIAEITKASYVYIALKDTYLLEEQSLKTAIAKYDNKTNRIHLYKMHNYYPAGDEQIMVCDITGKTVPPSGIPLDVGAVVSNAATVYAVYEAAIGRPFTKKYLTLTGEVAKPCIVHTPIGTSFYDCLQASGGSLLENYHVIAGGPMMGKLYTKEEAADLIVTKTTSGYILVPDHSALVQSHKFPISLSLKQAKMSCIQCSYCTQMCPRYLTGHPIKPHMIMRRLAYSASPEDTLNDPDVQNAMLCSECGICETYACPMGLKPRQVNIHLKSLLRRQNFRYKKPEKCFYPLEERNYRRISGKRLCARLSLDKYYDYQITDCSELNPETVRIPFLQHIGTPSVPIVQKGDRVSIGQLIAAIPDSALGAEIHASIRGIIQNITGSDLIITADDTEKNGGSM